MNYQQREIVGAKRREFSRQSLLLGGLFILTAILAVCVDVTGVLEYFKVLTGSASMTLETGAAISGIAAVPFLAMGMSISADGHKQADAPQRPAGHG